MSTAERGGGGDGGQGLISRQFGNLLRPRLPRAEEEQGSLDPPAEAVFPPAAVGSESQPPPVYGSPEAAGSGSQAPGLPPGVTRGTPPAPEDEQRGLDPPAAAGGSPAAETSLVIWGAAEQEGQQGPPRNLASRCRNFRFDDKKLWVCAAGVFLVLPLPLGIIYLLLSR